jgi:hypothetical protein
MKIEWTADKREVPALERVMSRGDVADTPDEIAQNLIEQGLAKSAESDPED